MNKRLNSIKALKFLILVFLVSFLAVSLISCGKSKEQQAKEFFNLGITYYKQNKTPEAVISFKNAIQLNPEFVEARYQLALCYKSQAKFQGAQNELETAFKLSPKNTTVKLELASVYQITNNADKAIKLAKEVTETKPLYAEGYLVLAESYLANKNPDKALENINVALKLKPELKKAPIVKASILLSQNKPNEAIQVLKKVSESETKNADVHIQMGQIYSKLKKYDKAEKEFKTALAMEPDSISEIGRAHV